MGAMGAIGYVVLGVFLVVLSIGWTILPFAIIGTKPLLRELLEEMRRSNLLLERLVIDVEQSGADES